MGCSSFEKDEITGETKVSTNFVKEVLAILEAEERLKRKVKAGLIRSVAKAKFAKP